MIDKNTIIGFILIAAILIGFGIYNAPTEAERLAKQRALDSLAQLERQKQAEQKTKNSNAAIDAGLGLVSDSVALALNVQKYGSFAGAAQGKSEYLTLENENIAVKFSSKGGRIVSVLLKNYKTFDKKPLYVLNEDSSAFNLELNIQNRIINTADLYFSAVGENKLVTGTDSATVSFKLAAAEGKYIEFVYSLKGNDFWVGKKINLVGLEDLLTQKTATLNWQVNLPSHEKNINSERAASTIYYRTSEEGVDYLSETNDESENIKGSVKWFSFKAQFFTSVLVFANPVQNGVTLQTKTNSGSKQYVKETTAKVSLPLNSSTNNSLSFNYYFGPNHYNTLKKYDLGLEKQVPLGWGIFGWVNRFIVIPVFHFFGGFGWNYGIVILCLTIVFKTLLFPLTYKAYLSAAKMRVLKPELDEINRKFEKADPLKKQQEVMNLYRSAGVNPMGGCLPMLLQLPILIALFRFFPSSIELRQQGFLWADDLSSFDSVLQLGFNIPFYGDHVSLFALLMTISTVIYTYMNSQITPTDPNMAAMKWMMYLMPVVFLGVMNSSSAGLSYYYLIANLITIGQQYVMRKLVDENAIYAKIQENKKKPLTKSKFQQRLEEMAKQRGIQLPNQGRK